MIKRTYFGMALCTCLLFGTMTGNAQNNNRLLIHQAAEMYGFSSLQLGEGEWDAIEKAQRQLFPNVDMDTYQLNITQAVAVVYIGLVLRQQTEALLQQIPDSSTIQTPPVDPRANDPPMEETGTDNGTNGHSGDNGELTSRFNESIRYTPLDLKIRQLLRTAEALPKAYVSEEEQTPIKALAVDIKTEATTQSCIVVQEMAERLETSPRYAFNTKTKILDLVKEMQTAAQDCNASSDDR